MSAGVPREVVRSRKSREVVVSLKSRGKFIRKTNFNDIWFMVVVKTSVGGYLKRTMVGRNLGNTSPYSFKMENHFICDAPFSLIVGDVRM